MLGWLLRRFRGPSAQDALVEALAGLDDPKMQARWAYPDVQMPHHEAIAPAGSSEEALRAAFDALDARLEQRELNAHASVSRDKHLAKTHPTRWRDTLIWHLWGDARQALQGKRDAYVQDPAGFRSTLRTDYAERAQRTLHAALAGPWDEDVEAVFRGLLDAWRTLAALASPSEEGPQREEGAQHG